MAYNLITDLSIGDRASKLHCRLARIWDCNNPAKQNQLISVDFLLIDEKGNSIQGTIKHQEGLWFKQLLKEGNIYVWTGFIVIPPRQGYRVCPTSCYISVSKSTTKVEEIQPRLLENFPSHSFNFANYELLTARMDNNTYLSDVIGELTCMGSIDEVIVRDTTVKKRNLELKLADGNIVLATLWTDIAYQIDDMHVNALSKEGSIIVIIAAIGVTRFRGSPALTSKSGTQVYLNLPTPETQKFRLRLQEPTNLTFTPSSESPTQRMVKNRKTIAELSHLNAKDNLGTKYTCEAAINDIDDTKEWWFAACPDCKCGIRDENGISWCERCKRIVEETPTPWYKLKINITDDTGSINFMIFGKHVERLVKQSASELAKTKNSHPSVLPHAIKKIIGASKIFELQLFEGNTSTSQNSISFKVTGVFEQQDHQNKDKTSTTSCYRLSQDSIHSEIQDASSSQQESAIPSQRPAIKIDKEPEAKQKPTERSCKTKRKTPPSGDDEIDDE